MLFKPCDGTDHRFERNAGCRRDLDSAGGRTPVPFMGFNAAQLLAPTGDGRIYTWGSDGGPIRYYDSGNGVHTLMDASGAAPYVLSGIVRALTRLPYRSVMSTVIVSNSSVIPSEPALTKEGARDR